MHWVFLILSNYLTFLQTLLFPFISGLFTVISLWISSAPITVIREGKRRRKRETSHTQIKFSYCQSTLPELWKNERKKDRARKKKERAELRKKEIFRKVKRMKDFAFLRIWHFTSSQSLPRKPLFYKGFRVSFFAEVHEKYTAGT